VVSGLPLSQYFNAFDFSISAAGYNTFHEVMAFGLPTIFIGNRHEAIDDQVARAQFAQDAGAALELGEDELFQLRSVCDVLFDPRAREVLRENSRKLARPNGAAAAADAIAELLGGA
jgi:UDP-N-acetylglucosamine:LPS N-acetylglucosamine transferase